MRIVCFIVGFERDTRTRPGQPLARCATPRQKGLGQLPRPTRCSTATRSRSWRHAAGPAVPDGTGLRRVRRRSPSGSGSTISTPPFIAAQDPDAFAAMCATPPAVHRYPGSMAARLQALAARSSSRSTTATPRPCGRPRRREPSCSPGSAAARLRGRQGADLPRTAGQAARRPPRRLGGRGRRLCRGRVVPVGGRRRRRATASPRCAPSSRSRNAPQRRDDSA